VTAGPPLVSVVTVCRNAAATLERTLRSVAAQDWPAVEHIVIDGASTDGTAAILARWRDRLAHVRREPDSGIAEAFDRGIAQANGRYVALVNADDVLQPDQLRIGVEVLERTGAAVVFGDLLCVDAADRPLFLIAGDPAYARTIDHVFPSMNHPTMLVRRSAYQRIGGFDPRLRVAMDYDWCLRAPRAGLRFVHEPRIVGRFSLGGVSDRRWLLAAREVRDDAIRHGLPVSRAYGLWVARVVRAAVQRGLRPLLPEGLHAWLRRQVNADHRPVRNDGVGGER
jgi:glycosyltransferase involved in cell wall biosynthesis